MPNNPTANTTTGTGATVQGHCDSKFSLLGDQFRESFARGPVTELGAAIAVYLDGKAVVDLWGGSADPEQGTAWEQDTHCCAYSCTKGVMSLLAMRLVDKGLLDYEQRVSAYWPDFDCHGKGDTTVGQLLSHQAGLPHFTGVLPPGGLWDWRASARALASAAPEWQPGSRHGYHALTWGQLAGSLFERASGETLEQLLDSLVCGPSGASFKLGPQAMRLPRLARLVTSTASTADMDRLPQLQLADQQHLLHPEVVNSRHWRQSTWPGAGGYTTARDLARLYWRAIDPQKALVSAETLAAGTEVRARGEDAILRQDTAFSAGFQRPSPGFVLAGKDAPAVWGHRGMYGAIGIADPDRGVTFAYLMNRCENPMADQRLEKLLQALYECL